MDQFVIKGQKKLSGDLTVSGSKNATLPLLAASLLCKGKTILRNVPDLKDIHTMLNVIKGLGVEYSYNKGLLEINTQHLTTFNAPYELVKTMRASIYVLGPLLAREGKAEVSLPGGCAIGPRPVNLHIETMGKLGAKIKVEDGFIKARANKLKGTQIFFSTVSVGATANLLMAAALAEGETIIKNAALEPEIGELITFLNSMGADIKGINTDTLTITGVNKLNPIDYTVVPDRIEAGTLLIAGIITKSPITIKNINPEHISALLKVVEEMGVILSITGNNIQIKKVGKLSPVYIKTIPYPGFPTDLHPILATLLTTVPGISVINETIFENRFAYIPELIRMGAQIEVDDHIVIIKGTKSLIGADVMASDLRGGAALTLAGLAANKETIVHRIYHIDRGYENLETKLGKAGANIKRIKGQNI